MIRLQISLRDQDSIGNQENPLIISSSPESSPVKKCFIQRASRIKSEDCAVLHIPYSNMQVIDSSKDGHCIIYALKNCLQASGFTPVPLKSEILTLIKEEFCNNFDTYYYKFIDIDTDSEKERLS